MNRERTLVPLVAVLLAAQLAGCEPAERRSRTTPAPPPALRAEGEPPRHDASPGPASAEQAASPSGEHFALRHAATLRAGPLELRSPHRRLAHQIRGSGHTHCAPDHSGIDAAAQQRRLMGLGPDHRHHFVWITAHDFVAPDPDVPGVQHMFGVEIYTKRLEARQSPHVLALLPDGALADPAKRPFGVYELDVQGASSAIARAGGLAVLAHPSRYSPSLEAVKAVDEHLWALEILSGSTDPDANAAFVDARLSAGKYTCLSAGGDIHDEDYKLTLGYQVVDVAGPRPTRDELFEAVRRCNFFACAVKGVRHGPIRRPALELRDGGIHFSSNTVLRSVRFIGRGGEVLHEARSTARASYSPQIGDSYVRVEAVSADGAARCYSQPTWIVQRRQTP